MPDVRVFESTAAPDDVLNEVRGLLDLAFEGRFSDEDWEHTLGGSHVVLEQSDGAIVSHAAVVPRTLEIDTHPIRGGYVEGVATLPAWQGRGLGSRVMREVARLLHGQFEIGALSTSAHHFYERLGWQRWQGPTFVRDGSDVIRTEAEDDGIMVLRSGASADVDVSSGILCESRAGDDW